MKLLVFSDTHGDVIPMYKLIDQVKPDKVIHLGDTVRDIKEVILRYRFIDISFVSGNNDFGINERELVLDIGTKRIFATHGHNYNVKNGLFQLISAATERKAEIVLFGHTHKPLNEYQNGILLFNPGALCYRNFTKPTYGILDIKDTKIKSDIFVL